MLANALGFLRHPKVRVRLGHVNLVEGPPTRRCSVAQVRASEAEQPKRDFLRTKGLTEAEIEEAFKRYKAAPPTPAAVPAPSVNLALQRQPPPPPPARRTWTSVFVAAGIFAGMGTGSYYLAKVRSGNATPKTISVFSSQCKLCSCALQRNMSSVRPLLQRAILWILDADIVKEAEVAKRQAIEAAEVAARRHIKDLHKDQNSSIQAVLEALAVHKEEVREEVKDMIAKESDVKSLQDSCIALQGQVAQLTEHIARLESQMPATGQMAGHASRIDTTQIAGPQMARREEEDVDEVISTQSPTFGVVEQGTLDPGPSCGPASMDSERSKPFGLPIVSKSPERTGRSESRTSSSEGSNASSVPGRQNRKKKSKIFDRVQIFEQGAASPSQKSEGASPPAAKGTGDAPHPSSYLEVLEMLENGVTPPGIREIDDKPPNPNQPLTESQLKRKPKVGRPSMALASPSPSPLRLNAFVVACNVAN
eukprot:scaffold137_cov398-Prasinococcus_capsulatus_cf.AAC.4